MKFHVSMETMDDGSYLAMCDDPQAQGLGTTQACALDRLREALRYQIEMCPCSGIDLSAIELEIGAS